jgi:hypothetical protein
VWGSSAPGQEADVSDRDPGVEAAPEAAQDGAACWAQMRSW